MQNCRNQTTNFFRGPHEKLFNKVIISLLFDYELVQGELFKAEEPFPGPLRSCWCTKRPGEGAPTQPRRDSTGQCKTRWEDGGKENKI